MHVLVGFSVVVGSFALAFRYSGQEFDGFFNLYSIILLAGVPVGLAIVAHPLSDVLEGLHGMWWSITRNLAGEQRRTKRRLYSVAKSLRQRRAQEAATALSGTKDPMLASLSPKLLRSPSATALEADATAFAEVELARFASAERLFGSLGEFAPGVGMIGTLIGLVQLLANLRDFERLGPAMAIALLTTFYGLLLAHGLYLPLARLAANKAERRATDINVNLAVLSKVVERAPLHEIEQLLGRRAARGSAQMIAEEPS